ncbi:MAG TPA: type II secretion system protein GspG [Candidatus Saccharimonadales bacterium]|nr:type II secretion system protein GspG [Candidatus Saccharimonadales bacterium]
MISKKTLQPGFSYIEMLVVLIMMGILMTMVGPRVMSLFGRGRSTTTKNALRLVQQGLQEYKMDVGKYPDRLEDLIKKPEGASNWNGPYAGRETENPELPKDGWDNDLVYKLTPGAKPPYELYSNGDPEKEEDRIYASK